ncbi:unnamed protein product [Mycena citricolor]|uniref:Protein kinase domain-containing protein n=1 Tax=Mycena citricolor TaxID=2018698 RepID=A0AAD2K2Z5_9AGAR|nr:unnamed protein product [Mycena citricolor]
MAFVSCSPPRAPPVQYATPLGTRWAKETAAAGGVSAFDLPSDPKEIGHWVLGECVGKGASGRVKIAKHRVTGQLAAVKILPLAPLANSRASLATQQAKSEKQRLGIDREITMMKLMNHPNIMRIYDVYEGSNELFLILEYIQGGELFDFLVNRGRLPPAEALEYFKQIIYGLNYAHTFSIIHRDLKPENILIASLSPPIIKIADWGMAAFAPPSLELETSCGSPHYASPEIVNGEKYQGNATDIWSCGVILYALLTGRLPFDDKNVKILLSKVKSGKYDMPAWIDPLAMDLLSRMLVVDVSNRITIPEILSHPWLCTTPSPEKMLCAPTPSLPPSPSTLARPIGHPSLIDAELLESLRIIWGRHTDAECTSIKRDLCSPAGQGVHAKAFYFLLCQYREESLRARDNSLVPTNKVAVPRTRQRSTTAPIPQVSGLAPPLMSRGVSSKDRTSAPVGPRPQRQRSVPSKTGTSARPVSTSASIRCPRPPLARRVHTLPPNVTMGQSTRTAPPPPRITQVPTPVPAAPESTLGQVDIDLGLSVDLDLSLRLSSDAIAVETERDIADEGNLPLLVAPRTANEELQKTMDAVAERLNGLAKAQAAAASAAARQLRSPREDKENQSVSEGWSYVGADEFQSGLGLDNEGRNVVFQENMDPKWRKDKERRAKHSTLPALKQKRSTLSLLTSPLSLSTAGNIAPAIDSGVSASRLASPVVGEFKGWFSNLFSWRGSSQLTPGTGVIYSPDGLEKTRREVGLLLERLGVIVEGSGFSYVEDIYVDEDLALVLRCKVEEMSDAGVVPLKPVKFRVEFSAAPNCSATKHQSVPSGHLVSPNLNGVLNASTSTKARGTMLTNRTVSSSAAFPPGCNSAIVLLHEKGSATTFKNVWKRLKESYSPDEISPVPMLSPVLGTTPFMEQPQRFAL